MEGSQKEYNYDYTVLRPPQDVFNVKHSDHYIQHGTGKKAQRRIFYGVQWNDYEKGKLKEIHDELAKQKIHLPSDWSESETMRMMYDQKGDIPKVVEVLKTYIEFRKDPKWHTCDPTIEAILRGGAIYVAGKDKQYRPIVVLDVNKLKAKGEANEQILRAVVYALSMISRNAFVPGHVENWVMIADVHETGILSVPMQAIKRFTKLTQLYFSNCVEKLYIANPSFMVNASWQLVKTMLHPDTVAKFDFVKKNQFHKFFANIDPSQLEKKYGGTMENITNFWPPARYTIEPPYKTQQELELERQRLSQIRNQDIMISDNQKATIKDPQTHEIKHYDSKKPLLTKQDSTSVQDEDTIEQTFDNMNRRSVSFYDFDRIIFQHTDFLAKENAKLVTPWTRSMTSNTTSEKGEQCSMEGKLKF